MMADTKFKVSGLGSSSPTPNILVRGTGSDGIMFDAIAASVSGGYATATLTADTAFASETVRHFDSFSIAWEASTDGGVTWRAAGTTSNEISVLFGDPIEQDVPMYYGMLAPATKAADGANQRAQVIAKTWEQFADRVITQPAEPKRAGMPEGRPERQLTYWKSDYPKDANGNPTGPHNNNTATKMIQSESGDGNCMAWVQMLGSELRWNKIDGLKLIEVTSKHENALEGLENERRALMLIKNFSFHMIPRIHERTAGLTATANLRTKTALPHREMRILP